MAYCAQPTAAAVRSSYPSKPIRLIVPFAPAGSADIVTRVIAEKLAARFGQQVVIDNRSGAGGNIGTELAAGATPDGYTILMIATAHAVNATLYHRLSFDLTRDFVPLSLIASVPNVLLVYSALPVQTVRDLVVLAKASSKELSFGSAGNGSASHLAGELFKSMAGIRLLHVPYKGSPQAVVDVLAGRVTMIFQGLPAGMPHIKSGKLKALGVTGAKRATALPNVPTIHEAIPGYEADGWYGLVAPVGIPQETVTLLNTAITEIAAMADVRERLLMVGADAVSSSSAQFAAHVKKEIMKWAQVVRQAGVVVQ